MAEPNILLTRIDNRLVHGQVATQWNSTLGSNLILVANDDVASNTMRQNLMKMAAPAGVATRCAYKEGKHRQHAHVGRKAPSRHLRRS